MKLHCVFGVIRDEQLRSVHWNREGTRYAGH